MGHTEITVHRPMLDPDASGYFVIRAIGRLLLRTSVIWGGFAILVPELGLAWYAVLIVLVMLNHLFWVRTDTSILAANSAARAYKPTSTQKREKNDVKTDNALFTQRVNL